MRSGSSCDLLRRLGGPKFIAAPMVNQSELAFRLLTRRHGCELAFTQMIPASKYAASSKFRDKVCDWQANVPRDRPLIVQLNGHDADSLVTTGKLLAETVDGIDLNLGCPQNIAKRGNYGAHLLQDQKLSLHILTRMASEIPCPVTVKIRIFEDSQATLDFVKAVEQCGVQMLTVHGRTIHEKKQYVREANWHLIKEIKAAVNIPVVANGGISCYADVVRCLEETQVDAVMSSEALLENPKLFCPHGDRDFREDYISSQLVTVFEYLAILQQNRFPNPLVPVVKAHLFKMLFRFLAVPKNHDLRNLLGQCQDLEGMVSVVNDVADRASHYEGKDAEAVKAGLLHASTWYARHLLQ